MHTHFIVTDDAWCNDIGFLWCDTVVGWVVPNIVNDCSAFIMLATAHLVTQHLVVEDLCDQQYSCEIFKSHSASSKLCLGIKT